MTSNTPLQRFEKALKDFASTIIAYAQEFSQLKKIDVSDSTLKLMNNFLYNEIPTDPEGYMNRYLTSTMSLWPDIQKRNDAIFNKEIAQKLLPNTDVKLLEQIIDVVNESKLYSEEKLKTMPDSPTKTYYQNLHKKKANIWKFIDSLNKLCIKHHYLVREPNPKGSFKFTKPYVLRVKVDDPKNAEEVAEAKASQSGAININLEHWFTFYAMDPATVS